MKRREEEKAPRETGKEERDVEIKRKRKDKKNTDTKFKQERETHRRDGRATQFKASLSHQHKKQLHQLYQLSTLRATIKRQL